MKKNQNKNFKLFLPQRLDRYITLLRYLCIIQQKLSTVYVIYSTLFDNQSAGSLALVVSKLL